MNYTNSDLGPNTEYALDSLFITNDTDCPVVSYALKLTNLDPFTDEDPSEIDLQYYHIKDITNLEITAQDLGIGNYSFFVLGKTQAAKYIYKEYELEIDYDCTPTNQDVTLTNDGAHVVEMLKNEGTVNMLTYNQMASLFTLSDTDPVHCPLWRFEIYASDGSTDLASNSELYSRLALGSFERNTIPDFPTLTFDTDVTFADVGNTLTKDFTFTIKAIAEGGATATKTVTAKIVVCRYEQISSVNGNPYSYTVGWNYQNKEEIAYALMVASNDSFCNIQTITDLYDNNGNGVIDDATQTGAEDPIRNFIGFDNEDKVVTVDSARALGTKQIWLKFTTVSQAYLQQFSYITRCESNSANIKVNGGDGSNDKFRSRTEYKNQEGRVNVLTYAAIQAFFTVTEEECPIVSIAFYDDDFESPLTSTALVAGDATFEKFGLATVTTNGFQFDTTTAPTDGNTKFISHYIKIVAFAEGGEWDVLRYEVKVQICGQETVSIDSNIVSTYTYIAASTDVSPLDTVILSSFFSSSDPDCPIKTWGAVYNPDVGPSADGQIYLNDIKDAFSTDLRTTVFFDEVNPAQVGVYPAIVGTWKP